MKLYTKKGDTGQTAVLGKGRFSKADLRLDTYGTVDELGSWVGYLRDQEASSAFNAELIEIQRNLFVIGAQLACVEVDPLPVGIPRLVADVERRLEVAIDTMQGALPPMRHFILSGGHQAVSVCHITRCVCRRAERLVVGLGETVAVNPQIVVYLNRLSDYFFALSRTLAAQEGAVQEPWVHTEDRGREGS